MSEETNNKAPIKPAMPMKNKQIVPTNSALRPTVNKVNPVNTNNLNNNKNKDDKNKKRKLLVWLLLLLLFIVFIGVGVYLITRIPHTEINFTVDVQAKVETEITDPNDGSVSKIKYVPGNDIKSKLEIEIKNKNGSPITTERVFLRFKIDILVDDNQFSELFKPYFSKEENWTTGDDGYYYFNFLCYGDEKITAFEYLNFIAEKDNNALNGKSGKLIFTVEILEGNFSAINDLWITAPQEWRTSVK